MGTLSKTLHCALTAASVWNWLVVHPVFKLTLVDTILSNKLLNLNPSTSLCSCFFTPISFYLVPELNTSRCWYVWFINVSFFFFLLFFILPCSITERFTVLICLVYKHLFFLSSSSFFFNQFLGFFYFFFYLKYTLGKGKTCLQRLKKVRLLQYLGVSDVRSNTIKRKKQ